jgi:hypothetical protein
MPRGTPQFATPPVTPVVKAVLIASGVMFVLSLALEQFGGIRLSEVLGFVPGRFLQGWLWQPFTYAFLHASMFHVLFNLLVVWTVGAELELLPRSGLISWPVCHFRGGSRAVGPRGRLLRRGLRASFGLRDSLWRTHDVFFHAVPDAGALFCAAAGRCRAGFQRVFWPRRSYPPGALGRNGSGIWLSGRHGFLA